MQQEGSASKAIVNCAAYREGHRVANIEISGVREVLSQSDKFIWVGLHEPGEHILQQVQNEFGLHDLAIEDAHRAHQRPKIETYGDSLFIVLRTAQMNAQHQIDFGETHFFVGQNFIVSVRHGSSLSYTEVRARCESKPHLLRKGPAFALYALMDSIVDQYFPVVHELEQQLEEIEEKVFNSMPNRETTAQIYHLKRELLGTALEANFSLISISQSEVGKKFAGWAAIIGVPTMIAGIYGMNFHFMPGLDWDYGFEVVLGLTLGSCFGLFVFFRRAGWL